MAEKPNILIAVPAYGGLIRVECAASLANLTAAFTQHAIAHLLATTTKGSIEEVRNVFASRALFSAGFTHILMVDHDMGFAPSAVLKLIQARKQVIGCAAPLRTGPGRLVFSVSPTASPSEPDNGILRVSRIGMALTLISVDALRQMTEKCSLRAYASDHGQVFGFFDELILPTGRKVGEDYSFCDRWSSLCGGEIFASIDEEIAHVDDFTIRARMSDHLLRHSSSPQTPRA